MRAPHAACDCLPPKPPSHIFVDGVLVIGDSGGGKIKLSIDCLAVFTYSVRKLHF